MNVVSITVICDTVQDVKSVPSDCVHMDLVSDFLKLSFTCIFKKLMSVWILTKPSIGNFIIINMHSETTALGHRQKLSRRQKITSIQWAVPIYTHFYMAGDFARQVGHIDLLFSVASVFVSRSVHARLQVCVCCDYDLFHPG